MSIEELRALYQSEDFEPFHLALRGRDQKMFLVATRDHIWVTPGGTVHLIEGQRHYVFDRLRIQFANYQEPGSET